MLLYIVNIVTATLREFQRPSMIGVVFFVPHSDFFNYLVSVTNNLSKRDHTEVACFLFVTHKNNMILDIPVLFQ